MKIALLGYGKMGKAIEEIALERGHTVVLKITSKNTNELTVVNLEASDVAIEFSTPENAIPHISRCFEAGIPVAVGTTGWYDSFENVKQLCEEKNGTLLTASNFSIGVNIFFQINQKLAALMARRKDYTAEIQEIHHTEKLDSPSGTAISLADQVLEHSTQYTHWTNHPSEVNNALEIVSFREKNVPGTHEITYDSDIDKISIKHEAKSRKGFALGAVLAAEFIQSKKGIYNMQDVLKS